eukprot:snap_masked-scaffold_2-processed-gene-12.25-mRNA-1 protein AED:1.00 eAED:1.00 QI:0/-1/0/0/-1/1/1/0/79
MKEEREGSEEYEFYTKKAGDVEIDEELLSNLFLEAREKGLNIIDTVFEITERLQKDDSQYIDHRDVAAKLRVLCYDKKT